MKKRVLITGAAGFIGFHAAGKLKELGHEVFGFDNFNTYYDVSLKESRTRILAEKNISVTRGDICKSHALNEEIEKNKITHLLHLAAQAGVRYSIENPHAYIQSNIQGFLNIIECCRNIPELKLVYASSSSVYGLNTKSPFSVDDPTDKQASLYGVTKKANELMAQTYNHLYGVKSVGLRFFTVYGPWGRPDMAYYSFVQNILAGKTIQIYNNGEMKRDFTYIDDIVDGVIAALDYNGGTPVFNLGNNKPVNLLSMVEALESLLDKKAIKEFYPMQLGDVLETYADIDQSVKELGFSPKTTLDRGLAEFISWYLNYHRAGVWAHVKLR